MPEEFTPLSNRQLALLSEMLEDLSRFCASLSFRDSSRTIAGGIIDLGRAADALVLRMSIERDSNVLIPQSLYLNLVSKLHTFLTDTRISTLQPEEYGPSASSLIDSIHEVTSFLGKNREGALGIISDDERNASKVMARIGNYADALLDRRLKDFGTSVKLNTSKLEKELATEAKKIRDQLTESKNKVVAEIDATTETIIKKKTDLDQLQEKIADLINESAGNLVAKDHGTTSSEEFKNARFWRLICFALFFFGFIFSAVLFVGDHCSPEYWIGLLQQALDSNAKELQSLSCMAQKQSMDTVLSRVVVSSGILIAALLAAVLSERHRRTAQYHRQIYLEMNILPSFLAQLDRDQRVIILSKLAFSYFGVADNKYLEDGPTEKSMLERAKELVLEQRK